jgi:hypothetical protein
MHMDHLNRLHCYCYQNAIKLIEVGSRSSCEQVGGRVARPTVARPKFGPKKECKMMEKIAKNMVKMSNRPSCWSDANLTTWIDVVFSCRA